MYSHDNHGLVSERLDCVSDNHKKMKLLDILGLVKFAYCHVSVSFLGRKWIAQKNRLF